MTDGVCLNPALSPFDKLLQGGLLAVIPERANRTPTRSHFESLAIWHTARADVVDRKGLGWLGRAIGPSVGYRFAVGGDMSAPLRAAAVRVWRLRVWKPSVAKVSAAPT